MAKRIIALNGSGRKRGNSRAMLDAFLEGVSSVDADFEIERIDLFDLDYKGCRGCHGCEMKGRKKIGCVQRDGAWELLTCMRAAEGIVFATPVFFWELSAQLRALLERYIYPGPLEHHQEIMAIYTMFQPEDVSRVWFTPHAEAVRTEAMGFLKDAAFTELIINQTQLWEAGKADRLINISPGFAARFEAMHKERWPEDLKRGRGAGEDFARRLLQA